LKKNQHFTLLEVSFNAYNMCYFILVILLILAIPVKITCSPNETIICLTILFICALQYCV
jgi:hypothetical protein